MQFVHCNRDRRRFSRAGSNIQDPKVAAKTPRLIESGMETTLQKRDDPSIERG